MRTMLAALTQHNAALTQHKGHEGHKGFVLYVFFFVSFVSFVSNGLLLHGQSVKLDPALLGKPPADAWPTYNGDYSGRRFSTLKQISTSNVKNLTLAWVYRLNLSMNNAIV